MKSCAVWLAGCALALGAGAAGASEVEDGAEAPVVELVVCLDVSGSMEALIDTCRRKLWDTVAAMAQTEPTPRVREGLLSYGGQDAAEMGHVVVRADLTEDWDTLYERLFELRAGGGTEYVGGALHSALEYMRWTEGSLRLVVVAGNEPADQDPRYPFRDQALAAVAAGATVHAVYCDYGSGEDESTWAELAELGGGTLTRIDPDHAEAIETPYDAELSALGQQLNTTYVPFGALGDAGCARQSAQDANAEAAGGYANGADRALAKASALYRNRGWDLVDAWRGEDFSWSELTDAERPEALRGLSAEACEAWIQERLAEREALQAQIQRLGELRAAYVAGALSRTDHEVFALTRVVLDALHTAR